MDIQELGMGATDTAQHYFIRDPKTDERNARQREYRRQNRERILATEQASKARNKDLAKDAAYAKEWRRTHPEQYAATRKAWSEKNREKLRKASTDYYAANRQKRAYQAKMCRERNPLYKQKNAEYRKKNRERINARNKAWWKAHPEKAKEKHSKYLARRLELNKLRRATYPVQRIKDSFRTRLRFILAQAGIPKHDHTFSLVGCTPNFLKAFLEAQFNRMMNWSNYGTYWEIDHIRALSKFNLCEKEQLYQAFHYSNCRPLEVPANRSKCDKSIGPHQPLLI